MPSPFDYTLSGPDPMLSLQQGMATNQQQRQGEQNLLVGQQNMGIAASQEARAATQFGQQNTLFDQGQQDRQALMAAQEAERQKALAMQTDLVGLSEIVRGGGATANDFAAIAVKYPDLAEEMSKTWEGQTQERKAADMGNIYKAATAIKSGAPQIAVEMLEERAAAAEAAGDKMEADVSRAMAATIQADPAAGLTTLGLLMHSVDPKAAVELFGEGAKRTVQSTQPYDNGTTVTVFNDGSKEVTDAAGVKLEGQAAIDAITAAQENEAKTRRENSAAATEGRLVTTAQSGEAASTALARGTELGKAQGAAVADMPGLIRRAEQNIALIDAVMADPALPDVTGNIQGRLPSGIPGLTGGQAGENLQVKLDQIQGQVFLTAYDDLRGAGAITEQEGQAAKAAIARMKQTQDTAEYLAALNELKGIIERGLEVARQKGGQTAPSPAPADGQKTYTFNPETGELE